MNITVTIDATPALLSVLGGLLGQKTIAPAPVEVPAPEPEKPKQIKKAAPKAEPAPVKEEAPAPEEPKTETTITLEELRAFANTKVVAGKKVELKALLDKHESKSVALLDPSKYEVFYNDLKAIA